MHRRAAIRQAIVTLVTGLTTTGTNVSVGRVHPETVLMLPALNVVTADETVVEDESVTYDATLGDVPQSRLLEMQIECRVAGDALDDQIDQIALEVETALGADATLGGLCERLELSNSEAGELSGELEQPVGLRTLSYAAIYRINARDPQ